MNKSSGKSGDIINAVRSQAKRYLPWAMTCILAMVTGCLMIALALRSSPQPESSTRRLTNVEVRTVVPCEYRETLILPARLDADNAAGISSEIAGRLDEWLIAEGGEVQFGQVIAVLNTDDTEAHLRELEVEHEQAKARLEFASREFERIKALAAHEISTASELDASEESLTDARLALMQTARRIESLTITVGKSKLRAPFNGRIDKHLVKAGEYITPGQRLADVYDLSYLRAVVNVPDRYIPFFDPDNPAVAQYIAVAMPGARQELKAEVEIPGPQKLTGGTYQGILLDAEVARVAQAADDRANTFETELRFRNPGQALRQGIICRARISFLVYPKAIVIPLKAIQVSDVGPRALVVERRNGRDYASVRQIDPVSIEEDRILIASGVAPGDRLLTVGGKGVLDGEQVNVIMEDGILRRESYDPGMGVMDWFHSGAIGRMRKLLIRGAELAVGDSSHSEENIP